MFSTEILDVCFGDRPLLSSLPSPRLFTLIHRFTSSAESKNITPMNFSFIKNNKFVKNNYLCINNLNFKMIFTPSGNSIILLDTIIFNPTISHYKNNSWLIDTKFSGIFFFFFYNSDDT